jgi:hypothetical protein
MIWRKNFLIRNPYNRKFNFWPLSARNRSIPQCRFRIHLGFQAITVFIKDIIHTPFGKSRFFIEAAAALPILIAGCAYRHFFLLTKIDFQ